MVERGGVKFPGVNFAGGNFPRGQSSRGQLPWGQYLGGNFPRGKLSQNPSAQNSKDESLSLVSKFLLPIIYNLSCAVVRCKSALFSKEIVKQIRLTQNIHYKFVIQQQWWYQQNLTDIYMFSNMFWGLFLCYYVYLQGVQGISMWKNLFDKNI